MRSVDLDQSDLSVVMAGLDVLEERLRESSAIPLPDHVIDSALGMMPDGQRERIAEMIAGAKASHGKKSREMQIRVLKAKTKLLEAMASDDGDDEDGGGQPAGDAPEPPAEAKTPEPSDESPARDMVAEDRAAADTTGAREPELATADI